MYGASRISKTPAGIETNERTIGVIRPSRTPTFPQRPNHVFGAIETLRREVEPAAARLEQRPAAVEPDPPADDRADEIAERAGEGERDVRAGAEADVPAEDRDAVCGGEDAGCDRARVEHHDLARRREDRVDRHQPEDGVDAV